MSGQFIENIHLFREDLLSGHHPQKMKHSHTEFDEKQISLSYQNQPVTLFLSRYNFFAEGTTLVTVTYRYGDAATCVRTIPVRVTATRPSSIAIYNMPKTTFSFGDVFGSEGLALELTYTNGQTKLLSSKYFSVIAPDMSSVGTQTVTITYTAETGEVLTCEYEIVIEGCLHKHLYTVPAVPSTCTVQGHGEYTECTDCGEVVKGSKEWLPLLSHVYDGDYDPDCNLCGDKREVVAVLLGDVNGDGKVNNRDLGLLQQYLNDIDVSNKNFDMAAADVNGDGKVNNRDAARLMQYLAGWDVEIH